jgi:hypothetical protein
MPQITFSPADPDQRYRLYIDESGDHVFRQLDEESHRYLCVLGCWFRADHYRSFHQSLEAFKQAHIPHNPDEPLILHREDIINRRGSFWRLRDPERSRAFDADLLQVISAAEFAVVAVVIDKKRLHDAYDTPSHPYHLAIGFMLQRYCGYLNHINRHGDVMAESRGAKENRLLMASYEWCYERGVWSYTPAQALQQALTTRKLKIEQKSANIAGLQLADVLSNPVRRGILKELGHVLEEPSPFTARMIEVAERKFNRHLSSGRVWGYGKVFYPKAK